MKHLVAYITSGYPDTAFTTDLALALGESGVDTLELGVPFSDPVADGPVIEKANFMSLQNGFKFKDLLNISKEVAPHVDTLWMGYFNLFYQYGMQTLLQEAANLHVKGMIIPDLPHEEAQHYHAQFELHNLANIAFVAPTDSQERIEHIVCDAKKFIYLVAYTGITGSGKHEDLQEILRNIKTYSSTPVYVGFGVNASTAKEKVEGADGVIVGSAFVNILLNERLSPAEKIKECSSLASTIKQIINE